MTQLPQTSVILAMSADGKISDMQRSPARFGSAADLSHLEAQVALADAVLFGAGTLRAYGTTMSVRSPKLKQQRQRRNQSPQPVQMVCSPSGRLDPKARFFQQPVPRWLLTTAEGARTWSTIGTGLQSAFEKVWVLPGGVEVAASGIAQPARVYFGWYEIWRSLAEQGFKRLAVLGGGQLTAALLEAGLVQEVCLTVCPLILGGASAPTPVDGNGFLAVAAPQLKLMSTQRVGNELFLRYRVSAPKQERA